MKSNTFKPTRFIDATNDYTEIDSLKEKYNAMLDAAIQEEENNGISLEEMGKYNPEIGCLSVLISFLVVILFAVCMYIISTYII